MILSDVQTLSVELDWALSYDLTSRNHEDKTLVRTQIKKQDSPVRSVGGSTT